MPTEQELNLIAKAKNFDQAAAEIKKVTDADRELAEQILKSSESSKEGTKAARQTIEAYNAQQEAARKATPATEALSLAQQRLNDVQRDLAVALKTGTVGEVERLTLEMSNARQEVERLSGGQQTLNAAEGDFISLLQQLNPRLGLFADIGLKATKVLDQIGKGNLTVSDAISGASKALRGNIGLLKTVAASGAVVAGIAAVVSQYRALKQEAEQATNAIEANAQAATTAAREGRARESEIGRISIANKEGPLTPEQVRVLSAQVGRVRQKFPGVSESLLNESAARLGPDISDDQLVNTAILLDANKIQLPANATAEQRRKIAFGGADRESDLVQRSRKVTGVEGVRARLANEAATQLRTSGGSRESIIEILKAQGGKEFQGADLDTIARIAQVFTSGTALAPESEAKAQLSTFFQHYAGFGQTLGSHAVGLFTGQEATRGPAYAEILEDERQKALLAQEGIGGILGPDVQQIAQGRRAAQLVENERRRGERYLGGRPSQSNAPTTASTPSSLQGVQPTGDFEKRNLALNPPTTVVNNFTYNNQNQRNVVPGRRSPNAVRNGDSRISAVQDAVGPTLDF